MAIGDLPAMRRMPRRQPDRLALERAGFDIRYTPTSNDVDHHTVQLPDPVTEQVAIRFNLALGRSRGRF
jgi:hypothetical protein